MTTIADLSTGTLAEVIEAHLQGDPDVSRAAAFELAARVVMGVLIIEGEETDQ